MGKRSCSYGCVDYFLIALYRHHAYDFLAIKLYTQNTMYAMIMSRHMNRFFFSQIVLVQELLVIVVAMIVGKE